MDAVNKAKARFKKYPFLVVQCRNSAAVYATCVLQKDNVQKGDCEAEFKKFKDCLVKVAANSKTKL